MVMKPEDLSHLDIDRGYAVPENEETADMAKFILSNDDLINHFIANMKGMMYNEVDGKLYPISEEVEAISIMNDYGVVKWAGFLQQMTHKSVLHSNMKSDEVAELTFQTLIDVAADIFMNHDRYGLEVDNFDLFLAQIKVILFTNFKRPQDAGERRALNTRGKLIEHRMLREGGYSDNAPREQGFFSNMRRK